MSEYLVGVYKEVGKNPDIIKIKNQKEYLEKLVDGEITNLDYDDYTIIYKKNSENLLANIFVNQYSKIGVSLKGKIFAVGKDENGNFISLNKDQAKRCISFFLRESFNYKNFDEHGRYIPRSQRKNNKKIFGNKNKQNEKQDEIKEEKQEVKQVQEKNVQQEQQTKQSISMNEMSKILNVGNGFFENQFRLEKVEANKQENNTSNSNENTNLDTKQHSLTNDSPTPIIKLSDEQTLNMILKVVFIILDFVRNAMEDSETEE